MQPNNNQNIRWYDRIPLSIRAKMLIAFLGLALLPILILGNLALSRMEQALEEKIAEGLRVEVATAASAIEDYLDGVRRDVRSLSRFLQRRLTESIDHEEWSLVKNEFLETITAESAYYQVRFIAKNGMERLRINNKNGKLSLVPEEQLQYKGNRYYVQEALRLGPGETYLSQLDFNIEHGEIETPRRLVIRLAAPVYSQAGLLDGLVVINVFGEQLLSSLKDLMAVAGMRVLLLNQGRTFIEMNNSNGQPEFTSAAAEELDALIPRELLLPLPDGQATVSSYATDLLAIAPVNAGLQRLWYLTKIYPQEQLYTEINRLKLTFVYSAILLAVIASLLAVIAARRFSRPIRKLSNFAGAIAEGNLSQRLHLNSRDELGQLSEALNEMAQARKEAQEILLSWNESLQREVDVKIAALDLSRAEADTIKKQMDKLEMQLLQANRLSALGLLSATVAHEIGNPLAGLRVKLQMLQRREDLDHSVHQDLVKMLALIDRLGEFLSHLTGYLAPEQQQREQVGINQVLRELEFILREEAERKEIELKMTLPVKSIPVCSKARHLHQIFMNLILNALQACSKGGQVEVDVEQKAGWVVIRICDNGCGLPPDKDLLFEPLMTTKPEGTGLGLAIVKQLTTELGGKISLRNRKQIGAEAIIQFPQGENGCMEKF